MKFCRSLALAVTILTLASSAAYPECSCDVAKVEGGWCATCSIGYLAGVPIKSELLFDVLDAHGHDIAPEAITCSTCRAAIESNGFCDHCRMGWIDQRAYMSRLTYHITKGETKPASAIACPVCRANAATSGWCNECDVGMVGNVAIKDKTDFEHASSAYRRLLEALQLADRCEWCAIALMSDGICTRCKKAYKNGKLVQAEKP